MHEGGGKMQVQQVWIGSLRPSCAAPYCVTASPILVHLSEEDMCCSVSVGDVVDIVGQASLHARAVRPSLKTLRDIQVSLQAPAQVSTRHLKLTRPVHNSAL